MSRRRTRGGRQRPTRSNDPFDDLFYMREGRLAVRSVPDSALGTHGRYTVRRTEGNDTEIQVHGGGTLTIMRLNRQTEAPAPHRVPTPSEEDKEEQKEEETPQLNPRTDELHLSDSGELTVRPIGSHLENDGEIGGIDAWDDCGSVDEEISQLLRTDPAAGRAAFALWRQEYDLEESMDYTGYEHDTSFRAKRVPAQWRFLRPRFDQFVKRIFVIQDPKRVHTDSIRVGRELDDWWINVSYRDHTPGERVNHYRSVREAIVLHSALARVDYDAFLSLLIRRSRMDIPRHMNLKTPGWQLQPKFHFHFGGQQEFFQYSWYVLEDLFGDVQYRDEFRQHWLKIMQIAKATRNVADLENKLQAPVPLKLTFEPERVEVPTQLDILTNITKTVEKILTIEKESRARVHTHAPNPPVFYLESIELNLRKFSLHSLTLATLEKLLKTGVHVSSLTLPELVVDDGLGNDTVNRHVAWASFVKTVLGSRFVSQATMVPVTRMVLPPMYTMNEYFAPFASALRDASLLKSLRIEMVTTATTRAGHTPNVFLWLGYALFSREAQHSLEMLELVGHQLSELAVDVFLSQCETCDPIGLLWRSVTAHHFRPTSTPVDGRYRYAPLAKGTIIQVLDQGVVAPILLPCEYVGGQIIRDDPRYSELGMIVPGFGMCLVNRSDITRSGHPRQQAKRSCGIKTLIFDAKRQPGHGPDVVNISTGVSLPRLLKHVGTTLTSFAWKSDDIDDQCIEAVIRCCPNLESFLLDGAKLLTMKMLTNAYAQGAGARPSSLDLRNIMTTTTAIDEFLQCLATPGHMMQSRLRRLAMGKGWRKTFGRSTGALINEMLVKNKFVTHVIVYDTVSLRWVPYDGVHHAVTISEPQTPLAARLAFLSCLKRSTSDARLCLPSKVLSSVFAFAANQFHRTVLREHDHDDRDE